MKRIVKSRKNKTVVSWLSRKRCRVLGVLKLVMNKKGVVRRTKNLAIKRCLWHTSKC